MRNRWSISAHVVRVRRQVWRTDCGHLGKIKLTCRCIAKGFRQLCSPAVNLIPRVTRDCFLYSVCLVYEFTMLINLVYEFTMLTLSSL